VAASTGLSKGLLTRFVERFVDQVIEEVAVVIVRVTVELRRVVVPVYHASYDALSEQPAIASHKHIRQLRLTSQHERTAARRRPSDRKHNAQLSKISASKRARTMSGE
jgi:pyruvate-formate lyase-activating enzyme